MHYSILIYSADGAFDRMPPEEQEGHMQQHRELQGELSARGKFATARLMPVSDAVTIRPEAAAQGRPLVIDGPFAETKERFMGFYIVECDGMEEAIGLANRISAPYNSVEVRPVAWAGGVLARGMSDDRAWLEARFADIRPKAIAALARRFRDLDLAEEAFSTSCLKALQAWPEKGVPVDPFAWLLAVGRNAGLDLLRRKARACAIRPDPAAENEPEDVYNEQLDNGGLRDDVLRLMFICCHPALAPQDQLAMALKIVAGMSTDEIARAFLVTTGAMEQRITRAKRAVGKADIPFETPQLAERSRRFRAVSLMLYLLFNEGWSASSGETQINLAFCEEAIRLARLLLDLFPGMGELAGLLALFLFQHSRRRARLDERGELITLDEQDRELWDRPMIAEATALLEEALRRGMPGPFQIQAAIAAVHAQADRPQDTDWPEIVRLYAALLAIDPTPVIRLNHAVAISRTEGPEAALAMLEPLGPELENYRWYHTARGGLLLELDRQAEAGAAYRRALMHGPTGPEERFLRQRIADCEKSSALLSDRGAGERP